MQGLNVVNFAYQRQKSYVRIQNYFSCKRSNAIIIDTGP